MIFVVTLFSPFPLIVSDILFFGLCLFLPPSERSWLSLLFVPNKFPFFLYLLRLRLCPPFRISDRTNRPSWTQQSHNLFRSVLTHQLTKPLIPSLYSPTRSAPLHSIWTSPLVPELSVVLQQLILLTPTQQHLCLSSAPAPRPRCLSSAPAP